MLTDVFSAILNQFGLMPFIGIVIIVGWIGFWVFRYCAEDYDSRFPRGGHNR